jgi:hypothetical protein
MSESERSHERRRKPRTHSDATSIPTAEFLSLLVSRRTLIRLDCHDGNVRGLLDLETGEKFLVERKDLLRQ